MANVQQPQQPNGDHRLAGDKRRRRRNPPAGKLRVPRSGRADQFERELLPLRLNLPRLVKYECGHYDVPPAVGLVDGKTDSQNESTHPPAGATVAAGAAGAECRRCREESDRRRMRRQAELEGATMRRVGLGGSGGGKGAYLEED